MKLNTLERGMRCTRSELEARQSGAIAQLRAFAIERSPFYRGFHRGFEQRPWTELPIVSKADLMENFDDFTTDRSVRLDEVEAHLERGDPNTLFRGRYVVLATSGSTGRRGIFLFSPPEWLDVVAASTRPLLWAGVKRNPFHRQRAPWSAPPNARTHSQDQIAQIAASIVEFGFNNPVLVDTNAGIIAGHGRILAARKLGLSQVPVVVLDHLTETQKRGISENAGWDQAILAAELGDLQAADIRLDSPRLLRGRFGATADR